MNATKNENKTCPKCWTSHGRSLLQGSCICTGDVLTPPQFHSWMGKKVPPLPVRMKVDKPVMVEVRPKLVFGEKLEKEKKKR